MCATKVADREPKVMKFLSHFADGQGNSIATAWAKRGSRKPKRPKKISGPQTPEIENLKMRVDYRLHPAIDAASSAGIDLFTCPASDLGLNKAAALIVAELSTGAKAIPDLIKALTKRCKSTENTARRNVYAFRSLLVEANRARQNGHILEMI